MNWYALADTLCIRSSRDNEAETINEFLERVRRAVIICEDLIQSYPNVTEYQALMGTSLTRLGMLLLSRQDIDEAADAIQQAVSFQKPLAERFSTVSLYQVAYLQSLWGLSEIAVARKDTQEAVGHLDTAIARLEFLTDQPPENRMLARYLENLRRRHRELSKPSPETLPTAD